MTDLVPSRPHGRRVVIVGAGFGGMAAARVLARQKTVDLTVVDRRNHHLFQPMLYQVATGGLAPPQVAWPIRRLLGGRSNVRVLMDEVTGVDKSAREVLIGKRRIPYDTLVIATGAAHSYFGHDEWAPFAPGLKTLEDAIAIRRRILSAFEQAEACAVADDRGRLLTIVVVGGGPTGVELAGSIAELARFALAGDFRCIDPGEARVLLIQAGPRLLEPFPEPLSWKAEADLKRLGVEVRRGAAVTACDAGGVTVGGERIPAATVLWAAGVAASPAAAWLGVAADRAGRVPTLPDLTLPDHPEIFVIGDTSVVKGADGRPFPGLAAVANQQGRHVAKTVMARLAGRGPAPFRYRDHGVLAMVGRNSAVARIGRIHLSGRLAWVIWGVLHIGLLVSLRSRFAVMSEWIWSYLTYRRGAQLIIGRD